LEARRYSKEDKEKFISDSNDDYYRHWLTYPNPPTPPHIFDAKQRLGQVKLPPKLARSASALNASGERQQQISQSNEHPESSVSHHRQKKSADRRHFLDLNLPDTPPELRAARHRLEKHRYHPSLDNYPPRPQANLEDTDDFSKPIVSESEDEQLPSNQTKDDALDTDEENKTTDNEPSSAMVQTDDNDDLSNEYIEAVEISDEAQKEYLKNLKLYGEKRADNSVYRIPSTAPENKHESFVSIHFIKYSYLI